MHYHHLRFNRVVIFNEKLGCCSTCNRWCKFSPNFSRVGKGREGKGREGKGRERKGREGKGREGKGKEGKGKDGK
jgi:hypothetical protein